MHLSTVLWISAAWIAFVGAGASDFHKARDGKWLPLTVPGISQGAFEVPSGGISVNNAVYVMLYNASKPRGITMRSAGDPSGPWSQLPHGSQKITASAA